MQNAKNNIPSSLTKHINKLHSIPKPQIVHETPTMISKLDTEDESASKQEIQIVQNSPSVNEPDSKVFQHLEPHNRSNQDTSVRACIPGEYFSNILTGAVLTSGPLRGVEYDLAWMTQAQFSIKLTEVYANFIDFETQEAKHAISSEYIEQAAALLDRSYTPFVDGERRYAQLRFRYHSSSDQLHSMTGSSPQPRTDSYSLLSRQPNPQYSNQIMTHMTDQLDNTVGTPILLVRPEIQLELFYQIFMKLVLGENLYRFYLRYRQESTQILPQPKILQDPRRSNFPQPSIIASPVGRTPAMGDQQDHYLGKRVMHLSNSGFRPNAGYMEQLPHIHHQEQGNRWYGVGLGSMLPVQPNHQNWMYQHEAKQASFEKSPNHTQQWNSAFQDSAYSNPEAAHSTQFDKWSSFGCSRWLKLRVHILTADQVVVKCFRPDDGTTDLEDAGFGDNSFVTIILALEISAKLKQIGLDALRSLKYKHGSFHPSQVMTELTAKYLNLVLELENTAATPDPSAQLKSQLSLYSFDLFLRPQPSSDVKLEDALSTEEKKSVRVLFAQGRIRTKNWKFARTAVYEAVIFGLEKWVAGGFTT